MEMRIEFLFQASHSIRQSSGRTEKNQNNEKMEVP